MANMPTITWVSDKPSASGKTVKVLLMSPDFESEVSHFAYLPVALSPRKWDRVQAQTLKFGDVERDYTDATGSVIALKVPRRQVSFFGTCALVDGEAMPETTWSDSRTQLNDNTRSF